MDVLQFRGDLYVLAADGPAERPLIGATDRDPNYRPSEYRMVWLHQPELGAFERFGDNEMMEAEDVRSQSAAIVGASLNTRLGPEI